MTIRNPRSLRPFDSTIFNDPMPWTAVSLFDRTQCKSTFHANECTVFDLSSGYTYALSWSASIFVFLRDVCNRLFSFVFFFSVSTIICLRRETRFVYTGNRNNEPNPRALLLFEFRVQSAFSFSFFFIFLNRASMFYRNFRLHFECEFKRRLRARN